ncbi:hypothetical protein ACHAXA_006294, partial [Cyclostephanos tholiformis]
DVFCDPCSSTRAVLPLDGKEYDAPVRVCDNCMIDVKRGNYFSMRRYLTPLQLYDPSSSDAGGGGGGGSSGEAITGGGEDQTITSLAVASSLSSLSSDIDAMLLDPTTFAERMTLPARVLVPAVGRHLRDRANGTALEQATKVVYYITDPSFVDGAMAKLVSRGGGGGVIPTTSSSSSDEEKKGNDNENSNNGPVDVDEAGEFMSRDCLLRIDVHRAFRAMLDHATCSESPSLQRWATASLRHLIAEDRRRARGGYASPPNSGQPTSSKYESFMKRLVSTGGIMILCSLLSSDDGDTRMHAASALEAIVVSTRDIGLASGVSSSSRSGWPHREGRGTEDDSAIVDAIVANGGCGPALAQLLISSDESVSFLGCSFASSMISPLLTDPRGSGQALKRCLGGGGGASLEAGGDDGLSSYRCAALALVVPDGCGGVSCLPSLIQILRSGSEGGSGGGGASRSMKLQVVAGECLAAISLAIGHIATGAFSNGKDTSNYGCIYAKAMKALEIMDDERIFDVAYKLVTSASSHSLDPSRNTPQARLREAAGLTLFALSSCSRVSSSYLVSNKAVAELLNTAAESLDAPSELRGKWASRGLCYLECAAQLLLQAWRSNDASCLSLLLEALDAGAVGLAARLVKEKVHIKRHDKAYSQMRIKIACCYMLSAMFGIAVSNDENALGISRLYSAIDADCAAALAYTDDLGGRTDLVASTVFLLNATLPFAQRFANEDADEPLPMCDLSEACMMAVGSMCGAMTGCLANDYCVAQSAEIQHDKSGMLVPLGDIIQHSLSSGEKYIFSVAVAIVKLCGPFVNVDIRSGSTESLLAVIRTLSMVLLISDENLLALKFECLLALEALSTNHALQTTMISDAIPSLIQFLSQLVKEANPTTATADDIICSALKTIQKLISLPTASSVAVRDIIPSLVKILNSSCGEKSNTQMQEMSIDVLHAIAFGKSGVAHNGGLLFSGVLESVASSLGGTRIPSRMLQSLEIIEFITSDIDSTSQSSFYNPEKDAMLRQFVRNMTSQEQFLRALFATMSATQRSGKLSIPPLYGPPLLFQEEPSSHLVSNNAIKLLFNISSLLCSDGSGVGKKFLSQVLMLTNVRGAAETVAFTCSQFIHLLMDEANGVCVPQKLSDRQSFLDVKLPAMRSLLLKGLSTSLEECMSNNSSREQAETLICESRILQLCLSFCQSKSVSQAAFDLYENIVPQLPIDKVGDLLLADKSSIVILFDLVTGQNNFVHDLEHSKQTFAFTLGNLAKSGLLSAAVERFGVRNNAIAALCASIQGSEGGNIDDSENSLPRICLESLSEILCDNYGKTEGMDITAVEAQAISTAVGKILSTTLLNRFFTQASLESTCDDSIDHSSDRSAISHSAEARLLCSLASFPQSLDVLRKVGGLEAIGLIAHEGELPAIRAIQSACELIPMAVIDVDAHISIMEALINVETMLSAVPPNASRLREVAISCLKILASLSQNGLTKSAIQSAEQIDDCLTAAKCIISASSKQMSKSGNCDSVPILVANTLTEGTLINGILKEHSSPISKSLNESTQIASDSLQLGDLVLILNSSPSKTRRGQKIAQLEGRVAYIGPVKFKPGDDWVGIQLIRESAGFGRNDGSVQGVRYFDCGNNKKDGIFVKKNAVKKQQCQTKAGRKEEYNIQVELVTEDKVESPLVMQQEPVWGQLLLKDDLTLERASFSLLLSLSDNKHHRDLMMQSANLIEEMTSIILLPIDVGGVQCSALELLVSFTSHLDKADKRLPQLFCTIVESRTRALQISREKRQQIESKQLIGLAISGLQNLLCSFMDAEEKSLSMKISSDLFVYLTDSLYKGTSTRRVAASNEDGQLFYRLLSFLVHSLGTQRFVASVLSVKFVSSLIRFIMMTANVTSFDRNIPISVETGEGDFWNAALSHSLFYLSCNMTQSSEEHLGMSYDLIIPEVEPSSLYFQFCLKHIAESKLGAASISAAQILEILN